MNILAMDLGKNNTVFCLYDSESGKHKFGKVKTAPQQIHNLLTEHSSERVVFEICSAAGWVHDIVRPLVKEVQVANTNHQAWRWKNIKSKNDRSDALKLAQLSAMNQLGTVHIPTHSVRQKRSLISYRQSLVGRRIRIKNSIRAILDKEGYSNILPKFKQGWSNRSMEVLNKLSQPMEKCNADNLWRGQLFMELQLLEAVDKSIKEVESRLDEFGKSDEQIKRLRSIPGVGPRLAEAVAAFLDEPERFKSGKQVGSYVGLTPRQYQSGQMDHQGKISGQGNKILRSLLVEVSWLGLRHNRWMNETYHRILRGSSSRRKIAIIAVARKLLVRCWAMMRDEKDWRKAEMKEAA